MQLTILFLSCCLIASVANAAPLSSDLDSTQERALKDAVYYLNEVDRTLPTLVTQAQGVGDGSAPMGTQELHNALNQVEFTGQKLNNALSRLQTLPAGNSAVATENQRATNAATQLLACEQAFKKAQAGVAEALSKVGAIEEDAKRLQALSLRIANGDFILRYPAEATETIQGLPRNIEFREKMQKQYGPVLGEHVGQQMQQEINGFDYRLVQYREAMTQSLPQIPGKIQHDMEQAQRLSDLAVERNDVRSLTNGAVEQMLARIDLNLALMEAIGGKTADTRALTKAKKDLAKSIQATHKSLKTQILAANRAPNDLYKLGDKAQILADVKKAWKKNHAKEEVLGMRIPMDAWERSQGIRWAHDRYELHDFSQLQVAVTVKHHDEIAYTYYVHLERDHLKGDKQTIRIDDRGEVALYRQMLIANWK